MYSHFTCATDTENVNLVFSTTADIIVTSMLKELNLL